MRIFRRYVTNQPWRNSMPELTNKIKVTDIYWDTTDEDLLAELPVSIEFDFPDSCNLEEDLGDAIADAYECGITHLNYEIVS